VNLSARLTSYFSAKIRQRGQDVYGNHLVKIKRGSDEEVEARVQGSQLYDVGLDWQDGFLDAWCDCPYFDSTGPCKHLWATILAAEASGYLSPVASAKELEFYYDDHGESENYEPYEDDESLPHSSKLISKIPKSPAPKLPTWRDEIAKITNHTYEKTAIDGWPVKRQIFYIVDVPNSLRNGAMVLSLLQRDRKVDGSWTRPFSLTLKRHQISQLPIPADREILAALENIKETYGWTDYNHVSKDYVLKHPLAGMLMPQIVRTGRCYLGNSKEPDGWTQLLWDEDGTWRFGLKVGRNDQGGWKVTGFLHRGEERMDLSAITLATEGGLVFTQDRVAPFVEDAPFAWIAALRKEDAIEAPENDRDELMTALLCAPGLPELEIPEELRYEEIKLQPRPRLRVRAENPGMRASGRLQAELSFHYENRAVPAHDSSGGWYDAGTRRFLRRDFEAETAATGLLAELGVKFQAASYFDPKPSWEIAPSKMPRIIRALVEAGWHVEAQGKNFRRPGAFRIQVSSGVDWFELHGEVEYGESKAQLPALLEAVRRGENMVRLDDGSYGMLPEEWLRRVGHIAGLGTPDSNHIRFRQSQAGLLDALLATQPESRCDETFARVRKELCLFQGVQSAEQPAGFVGHMRDYQRDGLGWMHFLQRFSFGGCLADDMGVGKTAQVLALLETRRELRAAGGPVGSSLVVVPKSLVFNWKQEAARFTPQMRVLDYTGLERKSNNFEGYDLVLTTYGTVRRDALSLKDIEFDYIVIDEAQAVKNASTESSKAVRLLRGKYRLALSGTPVENHLGELWTLFEFLNPGMLGAASVFKLTGEAARNPDGDTRRLLAHALRPFILRRTKEQVARELPPKSEQTIYCEMEPVQRKLYNELRQHYRNALLKRIDVEGLAKSKILVLEALLRLRQAACHPGLIDRKHCGEPSAKLDVLLERLREIVDEGHKALVFSQFTSLLNIVRDRLDSSEIAYEYLDGRTRDRQARVERFQNDANCRLFLISLKAGGLGLNLTAAEYVFLLDPWWNPAVEAQAVDRAHRIGQTKHIFAYRLIARDSVEEKVLELQKTKLDLATAIIGADNSLMRDLRREDLELLLS